MGIYQRGRVWWGEAWVNGQRIRKPLHPNKTIAQIKYADMVKARERGRYGSIIESIPWTAFKKKYLAYSAGKAKNTHKVDLRAIRYLEAFRPPQTTRDLNSELLELWKADRIKNGYSPATINRELNALKALRHKAAEWGYLETRGRVKSVPETPKTPDFFTHEEFEAITQRAAGMWLTAFMLGTYLGLRPGETYWLSWEDISLKERIVSIRPKFADGVCIWNPKAYQQRRIPICDKLFKYLGRLKHETWVIGNRPEIRVFHAYPHKICSSVGIKGSLNKCRHTFASWLVQSGVDIFVVSKLLGHRTITHTMKYAALVPLNLKEAVSKL